MRPTQRSADEFPRTQVRLPPEQNKPVRANAEARRAEIVLAAARLIEAKGYVQTTIDDIAAEIGQSKGTIYYYFETKEDILFQIHLKAIEYSIAFVRDILDQPISSRERVRALFHRTLEFIGQNRAYSAVFLESHRYIRGVKFDAIREKRTEFEQLIGKVFQQGVQAGEFRSVDSRMATLSLLGQANWVLVWFDPVGPLTIAQVADVFADIFLNGLNSKLEI